MPAVEFASSHASNTCAARSQIAGLPLYVDLPAIRSSTVTKARMAKHAPTILVVEDEPIVRMGITEHLLDEGFNVLEASNAADAITSLSDNRGIQLVFTDIDLGAGLDGLELCEAVQKRWPPVEIFVTSGRRQPEKADECRFARFFPKPYDTDAVTAAIRKAIAAD